ncbi:saccharopine dehydrogenase [Kribbella turkmenica]|uniref:Saccharopine dehydrogenase n=1 Tax=Kribbella turkmenica TaxID=2530375 RepID=A0A4R4W853_9ACTN|nr:saccharopine dehydrogenase NADP-binding domain-containing protein [Kribbella turkmenica]TDD14231.1 saccharopine dehydrogenase [Kribbella turkmenica]
MTAVVVYGATGHTGRFVVAELARYGLTPLPAGRRPVGERMRQATVDDPASLDRALDGADAVINTAGPFATTAGPVIEAALRAGIPYVDVAAEIEANASTFAGYPTAAAPVVPAVAFFGGLGDLLVTAALGERSTADSVQIAYGLSSWHPTPGTRVAGEVSHDRRAGRRVRFRDGALEYHDDEPTQLEWKFPEPLGVQAVIAEFSMADVVTVPSHVDVPDVRTFMTAVAAGDLADPDTPAPALGGDADQTFVVDVRVRADGVERRAVARGRDIYAVTAPLAVEAVRRLIAGETRTAGVASAGAMFDAADFLRALAPQITVELP